MKLTTEEIDFLLSQPASDLESILSSYSPEEAQAIVQQVMAYGSSTPPVLDERTAQAERMKAKRARARDIAIPLPANPDRRNECLADGNEVLFLQTYFASTFFQGFTVDRQAMLSGIISAARYGGDHAIAGPRGEGKTRLAIYGALYLAIRRLSVFPIVIGKSQTKSQNELKTIKERLQQNELLIADFPEIGVPFQAVGPWSSRARMQTVNGGEYTNIEIGADHLIFPTITRAQLPDDWPEDCEPVSCGQILSSLGVDGPIRGTNFRDERPTLAILDDIENAMTADSDTSIEANEDIIEKDIGGLGGSGRRVSRVMLCTTQNRKCIAYKYTDRKQKPSWNGVRFRKMITRPDRMDLWERYIELRQGREDDDPEARAAHRFYVAHRDKMDEGCEISNPYSYDRREYSDGDTVERSAIQAYFNRVADFGPEAVATEDDNDPPEETGPVGLGLTAALVSSRVNGMSRFEVPAETRCITVGIDVGKYNCHYTIGAWTKAASCYVCDYGIAEVSGTSTDMDKSSSEPHIYRCLLDWRDWLMDLKIVDATGARRTVDAVFVDSGDFTDAVYEFVRQVGGSPFFATKGMQPYHGPKTSSTNTIVGEHLHAAKLDAQKLWLYHLDTDFWKQYVHLRFLTPTFNEDSTIHKGSMSLFNPGGSKKHLSYSQHIVAEEYVSEFVKEKGEKRFWIVHNRNNHWLDATTMMSAAASTQAIHLLRESNLAPVRAEDAKANRPKRTRTPAVGRSGRKGGWVQGARRGRR